jgi:hypothetical protein
MAVLLVGSLPWVLANQTRSLVQVFRQHRSILMESRLDQYFKRASKPLKEPYLGVAAFVQEQKLLDIGLVLPYDPFEYQLWVLLRQGRTDVRLEHVEVGNVSSTAAALATNFTPAAIIRVQSVNFPLIDVRPRADELRAAGSVYIRQWSLEPVEVYIRKPGVAPAISLGENGPER